MIAHLKGTVLAKSGASVVVDVHNVGYEVRVPLDTLEALREADAIELWTHVVGRENTFELYGFREKEALDFFLLLIGVSGVGPKSALAIIGINDVPTLTGAIGANDLSYLTNISGIGKKSAEKIMIELRDKLPETHAGAAEIFHEETDALEALRALGYSLKEAREALARVPKNTEGAQSRLKSALKILGAKKSR